MFQKWSKKGQKRNLKQYNVREMGVFGTLQEHYSEFVSY